MNKNAVSYIGCQGEVAPIIVNTATHAIFKCEENHDFRDTIKDGVYDKTEKWALLTPQPLYSDICSSVKGISSIHCNPAGESNTFPEIKINYYPCPDVYLCDDDAPSPYCQSFITGKCTNGNIEASCPPITTIPPTIPTTAT